MQKMALVTAGRSGMGAGVARKLATDGYAVGIPSPSGKSEAWRRLRGIDICFLSALRPFARWPRSWRRRAGAQS